MELVCIGNDHVETMKNGQATFVHLLHEATAIILKEIGSETG